MKRLRGHRILVLYWHPEPSHMRSAIRQHLRALEASKYRHEIVYWNAYEPVPGWIRYFDFDAVVLHTTFLCMRWSHLFPFWKWRLRWIRDLSCVKIALPQDEYDHSEVLDEWLHEWGVDVIFSNFDESFRDALYPIMGRQAAFRKAYTGYIDAGLANRYESHLEPTRLRQYDLVYRATHLPYWFGSHGQLKHRVATAVLASGRKSDLKMNVSTRDADTIVGNSWLDFLASGKAVLGCESGSSVLDRRGEVRAAIQYILRQEPDLTFEQVSARMPPGWDSHQFFALSPRHFEAVMTRTCQVLVEGHYDGVLESGVHYLALRRDLSNVETILQRLENADELQTIADRAYNDILRNGRNTYADLAAQLDEALSSRLSKATALPWAVRPDALLPNQQLVMDPGEIRGPSTIKNRLLGPVSVWMGDHGRRKLSGEIAPQTLSWFRWSARHPDQRRLALRALTFDPALRSLFLLHSRSPKADKRIGSGQVLEELAIFWLLREARDGQSAGEPYRWDVLHDPEKNQLRLVSRPPSSPAIGLTRDGILTALASNPTLVLDHRAIGNHLHHAISSKRWLSFRVGPEPLQLGGLAELASIAPDQMAYALTTRLQAGVFGRLMSNPGGYLSRGYLAAATILRDPTLRAIWLAYVSRPRLARKSRPDRMIEDLLKLSLLRNQAIKWSYNRDSQTLTMTTIQIKDGSEAQLSAAEAGGIKHLIWDNSVLGSSVAVEAGRTRLTIYVGQQSRHEFAALETILAERPGPVMRALVVGQQPARIPVSRLRAVVSILDGANDQQAESDTLAKYSSIASEPLEGFE